MANKKGRLVWKNRKANHGRKPCKSIRKAKLSKSSK